MPGLPLADPDTWGYLNPALQHLAGNGMPQTACRSIAYPLFLRAVLGVSGGFDSIAFAQHILGLISGVVWILAFRVWRGFLPAETWLRSFSGWCAAVCLALYLCNPSTLAFESQIRPESIFPFFGLSQITATLIFIRIHRTQRGSPACILSAAASALLAAVCLSLKPSWGLAALVPLTVIAASILSFGNRLSLLGRVGPALAALLTLVFWNLAVPRCVRWAADPTCGSHLAGTLFTVHADIISREMHSRAALGDLDAAEVDFLRKLDERIEQSRRLTKSAYKILGHDPDYLLFASDVLWTLPNLSANDFAERNAYLRQAYLRSAAHEPFWMLRKIAIQMATAFGDASIAIFNPSVQWAALFPRTLECLENAGVPALPGGMEKNFHLTLAEVRVASGSQPESLRVPWAPPRWFFRHVVTWIFIATVLVIGVGLFLTPWAVRAVRWRSLAEAVCAGGVVWGSSIGSALTVSMIHSFDIDRYAMLQSSVNSLLMAVGLVIFAAMARAIVGNSESSRNPQ